jgi:hypothetical protein
LDHTCVVAGEPRGITGHRRKGEHRSAPSPACLRPPMQEGNTGSFSDEDDITSRKSSRPPSTVNSDALVRCADAAGDDPAERGIEDHGKDCTEQRLYGHRQAWLPDGPRGRAECRCRQECTEARKELGTKPHGGSLYGAPCWAVPLANRQAVGYSILEESRVIVRADQILLELPFRGRPRARVYGGSRCTWACALTQGMRTSKGRDAPTCMSPSLRSTCLSSSSST